jgi:hypothetical protein
MTDGEREKEKSREKLDLYYTDAAAADTGSLHFSLTYVSSWRGTKLFLNSIIN